MIDLEKIKDIREQIVICNFYMTYGLKRRDMNSRILSISKLVNLCQKIDVNTNAIEELEKKKLRDKYYAYRWNNWDIIRNDILGKLDMII